MGGSERIGAHRAVCMGREQGRLESSGLSRPALRSMYAIQPVVTQILTRAIATALPLGGN